MIKLATKFGVKDALERWVCSCYATYERQYENEPCERTGFTACTSERIRRRILAPEHEFLSIHTNGLMPSRTTKVDPVPLIVVNRWGERNLIKGLSRRIPACAP